MTQRGEAGRTPPVVGHPDDSSGQPTDERRLRDDARMINGCGTYRAGVALPDTDTPVGALAALAEGHGRTCWIALSDPSREEVHRLAQIAHLPPVLSMAMEESSSRASLTQPDGSLVLTVAAARYDPGRDLVEIGSLSVIVHGDLVITVARHAPTDVRDLRWRLEQQASDLARGPAGIVRAHLQAVIAGYGAVLADLRRDVEALEREVFDDHAAPDASKRIYLFKREAIDFQQGTATLIDPLDDLMDGTVPLLAEVGRGEWEVLRDRLVRLVDRAEAVDGLLSGILAAYQTDVALRQNEDMRKISAWVAIAAVPTLLAGVYGMNFEHMPELSHPLGYPILLGVMALCSVGLYVIFRTRKWL